MRDLYAYGTMSIRHAINSLRVFLFDEGKDDGEDVR